MAKLKIAKATPNIPLQYNDLYVGPQLLDSNGNASDSGSHRGGTGGDIDRVTAIKPQVKVRGSNVTNGSIFYQKGSHKFLVADENSVNDEDMVVGQTYMITSVGTTDWAACGADASAAYGDIFTAKAVGSGTGTVSNAGICTLVDETTPTAANTMAIYCTVADITDGTVSNIGSGTLTGYTNRTAAYLTWSVGTGSLFKVGQTVNLTDSDATGTFTVGAINTTTNLTIVTSTEQAFSTNTTAATVTFQASKISNKYVWDFLSDGYAQSGGGGFTGANNPNRYRYWLDYNTGPTDTFVLVLSS